MSKTDIISNEAIRPLQDAELDLVNGGVIDGCIRMPQMPGPIVLPGDWTFKDVFAKWTIGV